MIRKCLDHGLNDEQIEGILREHMWRKMQEQEQANATPKVGPPARAPAEACTIFSVAFEFDSNCQALGGLAVRVEFKCFVSAAFSIVSALFSIVFG